MSIKTILSTAQEIEEMISGEVVYQEYEYEILSMEIESLQTELKQDIESYINSNDVSKQERFKVSLMREGIGGEAPTMTMLVDAIEAYSDALKHYQTESGSLSRDMSNILKEEKKETKDNMLKVMASYLGKSYNTQFTDGNNKALAI